MSTSPRQEELTPDQVSMLRHELRTPVNLIVGYCEMLLEDVTEAGWAGGREALERALEAVREVLELINGALPATRPGISRNEVVGLYESLREPRDRILSAIEEIGAAADSKLGPEFSADVGKIKRAALGLLEVAMPGDGTEAAPARSVTHETEAGVPVSASEPAGGSSAARILVVDDIADNRDVLERRLRREGYEVECAADGGSALEMIAGHSFDLVLLDIMMPGIDGYEVLEKLKADQATRDIPVIMISALDELASVVRCIEAGAEDYLPKPFDPVLLRARLGACLEKKRLRDAEVEYLEQVNRVIEAASAVEGGAYEPGALSGVTGRSDELGRLARVFDTMATEVRSREERLRGQVDALRKEIEAARGSVSEEAEESPAPVLPTGELFAERYEILEELGRGGMGMVYRAKDTELDEVVAVKTLRPDYMQDPKNVERFRTEIKLARRISHRNVVRTHDIGESSGIYFLTMEYVEGITVRTLINTRGQLGVASTLAIARQLADSLKVAHEKGVIHRDIKPQNLLLDSEGVLKVMDFGVACLAERPTTQTDAGFMIGTPAYMSPEQLLGESLDARSDLFAVGVVMYECLTGELPLDAKSPIALVAKILTEDPRPPIERNSDIPSSLSALTIQLLARKPGERVQSAAELAEQLLQVN